MPGGPGCEQARCNQSGANAADGSADPEPKTATVERRGGERPASWDARRLASAWHAALWRAHGCSAEHPNVSRRSAPSSDNQMNLLGDSGRRAAIPGFFLVCKTGVVTLAQRRNPASEATREPRNWSIKRRSKSSRTASDPDSGCCHGRLARSRVRC